MPAFDIQPKRASAPVAAPRPQARPAPTRRESIRRESAPAAPRTPLKKKRKARRQRLFTLIAVGIFIILAAILFFLWQPYLRVQAVHAEGPDASGVEALVTSDLAGSQYLLIPKSSIFFLPTDKLRAHILASYPDIQAVSLAPSGLSSLRIETTGRITAFWWCGPSHDAPLDSCLQADMNGLLFAAVPVEDSVASSSELQIYGPLAGPPSIGTTTTLGSSLKSPALIPGILSFVKALRTLNVDVRSVDMRSDEADIYTVGGTRITYVMGKEQQAANLAATGFPQLNLNDGSLVYADLRFNDKVFFKKKGE